MSDAVVNSQQTKLSRHTLSSTKRYEAAGAWLAQGKVAKPQPPAPRSGS